MDEPRSLVRHRGVVAPVSEEEPPASMPPVMTSGEMGAVRMGRQISYKEQTSDEVAELEKMFKYTASTPRKAKRVYNTSVFVRPEIRVAVKRAPPGKLYQWKREGVQSFMFMQH